MKYRKKEITNNESWCLEGSETVKEENAGVIDQWRNKMYMEGGDDMIEATLQMSQVPKSSSINPY